jgi:hypothetical protein
MVRSRGFAHLAQAGGNRTPEEASNPSDDIHDIRAKSEE